MQKWVGSPPSVQEIIVLRLVVGGLANKEIADVLDVSEATAKAHVSSLLRKFAASNRAQLAALAISRGVVEV